MQKKLRLFLLALVLVLVLGGAYAGYHRLSEQVPTDAPSAPAELSGAFADFTVYDENGDAVALSSLLGKPVLINFWATWCPYCVEEFPAMEEAFRRYGDDVRFVMVNITDGVHETVEIATAFLAENGYTFPAYFDSDESACSAYGVYSYPTTLFLAADGTLMFRQSGAMTFDALETRFRTLLGQS